MIPIICCLIAAFTAVFTCYSALKLKNAPREEIEGHFKIHVIRMLFRRFFLPVFGFGIPLFLTLKSLYELWVSDGPITKKLVFFVAADFAVLLFILTLVLMHRFLTLLTGMVNLQTGMVKIQTGMIKTQAKMAHALDVGNKGNSEELLSSPNTPSALNVTIHAPKNAGAGSPWRSA